MAEFMRSTRDMIAETSVKIDCELKLTLIAMRWRLVSAAMFTLVMIAATLLVSFWFSQSILREARDASLAGIGLQSHQVQAGIVLTWDETKFRIGTCQSGKTSKSCLVPIDR